MKMIDLPFPTRLQITPSLPPTSTSSTPFSSHAKPKTTKTTTTRLSFRQDARPRSSSSADFHQTPGGQSLTESSGEFRGSPRKRVFLLDVNPLCYAGSSPSLHSFAFWASLLLRRVSLGDPVVAVFDGENGGERRRQLLPTYKAHRWRPSARFSRGFVARSRGAIEGCLSGCNVPAVGLEGHEADDVIATLAEQALGKGLSVVIASPDKDFRQLLSERVQITVPAPGRLGRWSFYTLAHYASQHQCCDPRLELSLRCLLGDEADGVPGIQHVAPGFGRKTALRLVKKHGSLEDLLSSAAVRTVGKQYAQDALVTHAEYLRRNYAVLSLRRDVSVELRDEWLAERDRRSDDRVFARFLEMLEEAERVGRRGVYA